MIKNILMSKEMRCSGNYLVLIVQQLCLILYQCYYYNNKKPAISCNYNIYL